MQHRLFVSQETLDRWLTDAKVEVDGEVLTLLADQRRFTLSGALHFLEELTGAEDPNELIGRVHSLEKVAELGGEHYADSVILGDLAYQVVEGFLGTPVLAAADDVTSPGATSVPPEHVAPEADPSEISGTDLASAARAATGDNEVVDPEVELLGRFFLQ